MDPDENMRLDDILKHSLVNAPKSNGVDFSHNCAIHYISIPLVDYFLIFSQSH